MQAKQDEVQAVEQKKSDADEVLKEKKKDTGKISRELAKLEQDIREVVSSKSKIFLTFSISFVSSPFSITPSGHRNE